MAIRSRRNEEFGQYRTSVYLSLTHKSLTRQYAQPVRNDQFAVVIQLNG